MNTPTTARSQWSPKVEYREDVVACPLKSTVRQKFPADIDRIKQLVVATVVFNSPARNAWFLVGFRLIVYLEASDTLFSRFAG